MNTPATFPISLAQWSLHNTIQTGLLNKLNFAAKAKSLGFNAVEYVTRFYAEEALHSSTFSALVKEMKLRSEYEEVKNLLIMVDGEGSLAATEPHIQQNAINNHKKWMDAAAELGCHSIRVNLFGGDENAVTQWIDVCTKGLTALAEMAAPYGINVIVENHGGISSNGKILAKVMQQVNLPTVGTLPDFGNFCISRQDGLKWPSPCIEEYDRYMGVQEMMPWAKGVSAKTYDFDHNGLETTIDYHQMMQIVLNSGYTSHVGVEYEGQRLSEEEGITATKNLLLRLGGVL